MLFKLFIIPRTHIKPKTIIPYICHKQCLFRKVLGQNLITFKWLDSLTELQSSLLLKNDCESFCLDIVLKLLFKINADVQLHFKKNKSWVNQNSRSRCSGNYKSVWLTYLYAYLFFSTSLNLLNLPSEHKNKRKTAIEFIFNELNVSAHTKKKNKKK